MTGRPAIASCLPGAPALRSALVSAAALRGTGVAGGRIERAFQAPMAEAAQAPRYALAANGADSRQQWAQGGFTANGNGTGSTTVATHHDSKMRAFRGLEPWRDPA
nr:hypothetical protein [Streptomyces sp. SID5468]